MLAETPASSSSVWSCAACRTFSISLPRWSRTDVMVEESSCRPCCVLVLSSWMFSASWRLFCSSSSSSFSSFALANSLPLSSCDSVGLSMTLTVIPFSLSSPFLTSDVPGTCHCVGRATDTNLTPQKYTLDHFSTSTPDRKLSRSSSSFFFAPFLSSSVSSLPPMSLSLSPCELSLSALSLSLPMFISGSLPVSVPFTDAWPLSSSPPSRPRSFSTLSGPNFSLKRTTSM
mmetsp:Transcript_5126/g.19004  ORF Transcript_5126/g.19004 Transcript_5126/m.19004 type:complete len:230 (+) Transcript_5126:3493-4182(+)